MLGWERAGRKTKSMEGAAEGAGEEEVVWNPCIRGRRVGVVLEEGVGRVVVLEERVVSWASWGCVSWDGEGGGGGIGGIPRLWRWWLLIDAVWRGRRWCW